MTSNMDLAGFLSQDSIPQSVLLVVGALFTFTVSFKLLDFAWTYFLRPTSINQYLIDPKHPDASKKEIASERSETKSWGLVTGASDGIGKSLADELAKTGFNVVIHGRNPKKLEGVLKGLQEANPKTCFRMVIADASKSHDMEISVTAIVNQLNRLPGPLTILANNVGGTSPLPRVFMPLYELDYAQVDSLISLNTCFTAQLTRALLPNMLERNVKLGAKAAIINTGSVAGTIGVPMQATYGGAKSFLRAFTYAVARELKMEGYADVSVTYMIVGRVTEAGPWTRPPTLFTPSARTFSKSFLHKIGSGRMEVTPYWGHAMQLGIVGAMPEWLTTWIVTEEIRKDLAEEQKEGKLS